MNKFQTKTLNGLFSLICIFLLAYWITGLIISYTFCSLLLLFFVGRNLYKKIGKTIPVREIIALLILLQCVFAPALVYEVDNFSKIDMAVDENTYFSFVLPAVLAYIIGLYWRRQKSSPFLLTTLPAYQNKGWILIAIGVLADFLPLGFLSYLLSLCKFTGAFYLLFSYSKYKYIGLIVLLLIVILQSLSAAMFHNMLIWFLFVFFILNLKSKMSRKTIFLSGLLGIGLFVAVQTVKPLLREQLWYGVQTNKSRTEVIQETLFSAEITDNPLVGYVIRLNEGWHISKVLAHIPLEADYGHGESYIGSITGALLPRIVSKDKAIAGGKENMIRYAGYYTEASMDIGLLGEAYGNFGYGGIAVMFLIGLSFGWIINFIEKKAQKRPELLLWIPFIFFQVIKAETSSITVFNHLAKSALIVWFIFSKYARYTPFIRYFEMKSIT